LSVLRLSNGQSRQASLRMYGDNQRGSGYGDLSLPKIQFDMCRGSFFKLQFPAPSYSRLPQFSPSDPEVCCSNVEFHQLPFRPIF
jgi:hypothetical protein